MKRPHSVDPHFRSFRVPLSEAATHFGDPALVAEYVADPNSDLGRKAFDQLRLELMERLCAGSLIWECRDARAPFDPLRIVGPEMLVGLNPCWALHSGVKRTFPLQRRATLMIEFYDSSARYVTEELTEITRVRRAGGRDLHPTVNYTRQRQVEFRWFEICVSVKSTSRHSNRDAAPSAYSKAEVDHWYQDWITRNETKGEIPTRNDDWKAAKAEFGAGLPREAVREARRRLAPDRWKRKGPRPRSGERATGRQ